MFEDEEQDLFRDLQSLPRNAALRKLNDLIKRARLAKVHAYIISELRKDMPSVFGKDSKKKDLIKNIGTIYDRLQREHQISPGDFPDIKKMQEVLQNQDFSKFHSLKPHLIETVDRMLATDIAKLMSLIPQEESETVSEALIKGESLNVGRRNSIITVTSTLHNLPRHESYLIAYERKKNLAQFSSLSMALPLIAFIMNDEVIIESSSRDRTEETFFSL